MNAEPRRIDDCTASGRAGTGPLFGVGPIGGRVVAERVAVVAVGGHESANGAALPGVFGPEVTSAACGRQLRRAVSAVLRAGADRVCVVPITLGRDTGLVADAARTLLALPAGERARVLLSRPFAGTEQLTGWLCAAAARVPARAALLVAAPAGDAHEDAELYRIARLVWQHGPPRIVEVALIGGDPDPGRALERCRLLGAARTVVLPASFVLPAVPGVAPLLSRPVAAGVLAARVGSAVERLRVHGDDGLAVIGANAPLPAHPDGPIPDRSRRPVPTRGREFVPTSAFPVA
ncbi:cobalamin biosynthesis protein CbiX [Embleya sp. NPDC005575]|uniref:sirohydrochlorin chelatase n=1 Tax=Embleya sp. NPDC005575 TaxID=3156892 RepID=UPI0033A4176B